MGCKELRPVKKRKKRPSMGAGQRVDCSFQCPAKGRLDFGGWAKKGETASDACWRLLRKHVDEAQIPYCKLLRARYVD